MKVMLNQLIDDHSDFCFVFISRIVKNGIADWVIAVMKDVNIR